MERINYYLISGKEHGNRLDSRTLEEIIQASVAKGRRNIEITAFGQHGIGGRLWQAGEDRIYIRIKGQSGQRAGSLGFPNTFIEIMGPASDDVGWLNAGAVIAVHGHAGNGTANGMAQGRVYIAGSIGARGMTMTKQNPRFDPPELWVLGSVGDYFGEFMAGGIAVICGIDAQTPQNIFGYRPLVGMVGGNVFFRGPHDGFCQADAKLIPINDTQWEWLQKNTETYLENIGRPELFESLSDRTEWQLLAARGPQEKVTGPHLAMKSFSKSVWDKELGEGGMIGDLVDHPIDRTAIPLITSNELRRFVPVWENLKYQAPCEATCPTGIPVQQRWRLIREGRVDEAVDLALAYTPFPATVCGYLCPNLCMQSCTRQAAAMIPVDVTQLGKASIKAGLPKPPKQTGKRVAVIGGGPAGISVAWQLRQQGHETVIYDMSGSLGGKIASVIPDSRLPKDVFSTELKRIKKVIPHVHLQQSLGREDILKLREDFDILVIAVGAMKPRIIPVPGKEKMIPALDFLTRAKVGRIEPGKQVVIIGAGNVGCDVATEAHRLGAETITLIDVQEPASFGAERDAAEAVGAIFRWPAFTKAITDEGVLLENDEILPADTVVISIGDAPDLEFLPKDVEIERGFIKVNDTFQTTDPKLFAIGDAVTPGLLTDAIGAGRKAAAAFSSILDGKYSASDICSMFDVNRVTLVYFDPRIHTLGDMDQCGSQCASCGQCRDCGICVSICPQAAISREDRANSAYEYLVDEDKCIGCGFCAGACPCGVWDLVENEPL
jgi:NADPH-dependent glutamate synthase beta subunit-like oxidoreductase/glutamate synthase domain-containing protein 3/NAD-dependent dihydropyrimidine dehydrogenase PreA subunit